MIAHSATNRPMPMTGARTCGNHAGALVRTYSGFSGAEVVLVDRRVQLRRRIGGPIPTRGGLSVCTMAGRRSSTAPVRRFHQATLI